MIGHDAGCNCVLCVWARMPGAERERLAQASAAFWRRVLADTDAVRASHRPAAVREANS